MRTGRSKLGSAARIVAAVSPAPGGAASGRLAATSFEDQPQLGGLAAEREGGVEAVLTQKVAAAEAPNRFTTQPAPAPLVQHPSAEGRVLAKRHEQTARLKAVKAVQAVKTVCRGASARVTIGHFEHYLGTPNVLCDRWGQTKYFLYGAPKIHDHYGLSRFCMDKR
jgi:hypothetical protein